MESGGDGGGGMSAIFHEEKDVSHSERIRQLQRRIERARPIYRQYSSGELRVMSDAQRRQVSMFSLWVEDLEALKQGRLPPVRRSKPPLMEESDYQYSDGNDHTRTETATDVATDEGAGQERQPQTSGDTPATVEDGGVNCNTNDAGGGHDNGERLETRQKKTNEMSQGKPKSASSNGFVGDPKADERELLRRLRSLSPKTRDVFLRRYVERVTDTEELRGVKKQYEASNNLRQKILTGAISRPSNAQLERVAELSELRRTLNFLKLHEKKEQQRLTRFFLRRLEEEQKEEQKEAEENARAEECVTSTMEDKSLISCAELEANITPTSCLSSTVAPQAVSGDEEEAMGEMGAAPQVSSPMPSSAETPAELVVMEGNDTPSPGCEQSAGVKSDDSVPMSRYTGHKEMVVGTVPILCDSCTTTAEKAAISFAASSGPCTSSSNTSGNISGDGSGGGCNMLTGRSRMPRSAIHWQSVKYSKNKSRLEIKAMMPLQLCQQIATRARTTRNDMKKAESSLHSGNESISTVSGNKSYREEASVMQGSLRRIVRDQLGYVQLNISQCFECRLDESLHRCDISEGLGARATMALRRVSQELQYVLRHPISRVDVVRSQVLCRGNSGVHTPSQRAEAGNDAVVAEWVVHVWPSDGPLAGQMVPVVVVFSSRYPFVPPLIYSTVFLPLTTVMVSESGQPNTLQLPWTHGFSAEGLGDSSLSTRCGAWKADYSVYGFLMQLQDFFGADAFAVSRAALGPELYHCSIMKARLACGRMIAGLAENSSTLVSFPRAPLRMVNGPFLVLPQDGGASVGETTGNEEQPRGVEVKYHEDTFQGMIHGPFKGCWGHLLMVPVTDGSLNELKESCATQEQGLSPVLSVCLKAASEELLPEVEFVAVSQQSLGKKSFHWVTDVLETPHDDTKNVGSCNNGNGSRRGRKLSDESTLGSRLLVRLSATEVIEEDSESRGRSRLLHVFFDVHGEPRPPRCASGGEPHLTHVYLPGKNSFSRVKGRAPPLAWAIVLHLRDGASASVVFSIPVEGKKEEESTCAQPEKYRSTSVVDVVTDVLNERKSGLHTAGDASSCSSLFCVVTLEKEAAAAPYPESPTSVLPPPPPPPPPLGVMCDVRLPSPSTNSFVPQDVKVHPNLVLSEMAFDTHFGPSLYSGGRFFVAATPVAPCTLFLPLAAENDKVLPLATLDRLKRTIKQLHRNPAASTAYNPPFKMAQTQRFFSLVLLSLGRQWAETHNVEREDITAQRQLLSVLYRRVLLTFVQLLQSEVAFWELCCTAFNSDRRQKHERMKLWKVMQRLTHSSGDTHRGDGDDDDDDNNNEHDGADEATVVEWLLASWSALMMSTAAVDVDAGSSNTVPQVTKEDWVAVTTELFEHLNGKFKGGSMAEVQLHANLMGFATSTS